MGKNHCQQPDQETERTEDTKIKMAAIRTGPLGAPINTKKEIRVKKEDLEEISRWRGAVLGPSQNTYPEPKLHTLKGVIKSKRLDRITTHDLGRAIRNNSRIKVTPRCKEAWGEKFTLNLPWLGIGKEFARNSKHRHIWSCVLHPRPHSLNISVVRGR